MTTAGFWTDASGLAAIGFAASLVLSRLVLRYALSRDLLDHPNARSSHTKATPRGGGLAIVVVVLTGLLVLWAVGIVPTAIAVALIGGGVLVASVGWLDDRRGLPAATRLLVHLLASIWLVWWVGGMPDLTIGTTRVHLGFAGAILAVLGTVWAVNLYNFMDGIDGLAAGEAMCVGLAGALLLGPGQAALAGISLLTAAAAGGFLSWNWPPARIFMGDVGSGFLGFLFAGLALVAENNGAVPALAWLVLLGVFFWDATVTLIRRVLRGERWYTSHRSHAYQRAVQAGLSHGQVSLSVLLLNTVLVGLAWWGARNPRLMPLAFGAAAFAIGLVYLLVERWRPMGTADEATPPAKTSHSTC